MTIEERGLEILKRIEHLEREIHQCELNNRLGWEYEKMVEEVVDLSLELTILGY